MVGTLDRECRCATSWCDLAVVTLTLKVLSGTYPRNSKVQKVYSQMGHWLGSVGMLNHGVTINFASAKVCSSAIFGRCFSCDKDIWIAVTDY